MKFIADILKTLGIIFALGFVFTMGSKMIEKLDKRSQEQKIEDQISELKIKPTAEDNALYADSEVVSLSYPMPNMTKMKKLFIKRKDGFVFSVLTEHEFKKGDRVKIITIYYHTGTSWETSFLLALPRK